MTNHPAIVSDKQFLQDEIIKLRGTGDCRKVFWSKIQTEKPPRFIG